MTQSTTNRIRLFRVSGFFISVIGGIPVFVSIARMLTRGSTPESIGSTPMFSSSESDAIIGFGPALLIGLFCVFAPRAWIIKILDWLDAIYKTLGLKDGLSDSHQVPRVTADGYIHILKRAGFALCILGVLDCVYTVYCTISDKSHSSYFNFYAIAAGYFLYQGGLRTAVYVRLYCAFIAPLVVVTGVVLPLMRPFDLTFTEIRLQPFAFFAPLFIYLLLMGFLVWSINQLGKDAILKAQQTNGIKSWGIKIPVALGCLLAIGVSFWTYHFVHGSYATKAAQRALHRVPATSSYSTYVTSLQISETNNDTSVSAEVSVWNKQEIYTLPVSWHE